MEHLVEKEFENGQITIPPSYQPLLDLRETETAIKSLKDTFQEQLADRLNLSRVSAPLALLRTTGVNDHLNGREQPVTFELRPSDDHAEIVQSLAKWKRLALANYGFENGEGLYTDMNALRPAEQPDNLHSVYVDQWDWERVITEDERRVEFLHDIVLDIYEALTASERLIREEFPELGAPLLPDDIEFIHTSELQERFPDRSPSEREDAICREHGAVFLRGIGPSADDHPPHDDRAADYDDWVSEGKDGLPGLNGDILVWYPVLDRTVELSSMGIRVDEQSLLTQLEIKDEMEKTDLYFHERLLEGDLPLTVGGGIGQSRLCMVLLKKAHVGEVQSSIWSEEMREVCAENEIPLL